MTASPDNPLEAIRRNATLLILSAMAGGGLLVTMLNTIAPPPHLISSIVPPLSAIVCTLLLLDLLKNAHHNQRVTRLLILWSASIIILPEYLLIFEALTQPNKALVETLPPFSAGIFLLTNCIIVFLNPQKFIRLTIALWLTTAAPILLYLLCHPMELATPRGIDWVVTLLPAMGINTGLILFNAKLQDAMRQLDRERFHLKEVSERDGLTGVYNRRTGEEILEELEKTKQIIGLIICDIDHFKQVNDSYGHLTGDRVIQAVVQCLQTDLRKQDWLMRWGGEEFVIVVIGDDASELMQLAERLRSQIASQTVPIVGSITASFGVALQQPLEPLNHLFDRADQALYQAKEAGRNQVMLSNHD